MGLPALPQRTLVGLAAFVRARLAELGLWSGSPGSPGSPGSAATQRAAEVHQRTLIVAATAPVATTAYARARLLRQMHACGLLTEHETTRAADVLGVAN